MAVPPVVVLPFICCQQPGPNRRWTQNVLTGLCCHAALCAGIVGPTKLLNKRLWMPDEDALLYEAAATPEYQNASGGLSVAAAMRWLNDRGLERTDWGVYNRWRYLNRRKFPGSAGGMGCTSDASDAHRHVRRVVGMPRRVGGWPCRSAGLRHILGGGGTSHCKVHPEQCFALQKCLVRIIRWCLHHHTRPSLPLLCHFLHATQPRRQRLRGCPCARTGLQRRWSTC